MEGGKGQSAAIVEWTHLQSKAIELAEWPAQGLPLKMLPKAGRKNQAHIPTIRVA
jgi:hypothetical protein